MPSFFCQNLDLSVERLPQHEPFSEILFTVIPHMFFDDDDSGGEVIPLITCEKGTYRANPEAIEWLEEQTTHAQNLCVCAIAGKYRTGKSFLMNRIMNAPPGRGFGVGDTVNACTKGLWLYKHMFRTPETPTSPARSIIFVDTEGIASLDADDDHDVRIFTLALLLSSAFVYNSMGPIDETSLQTLSLMTRISSLVDTTSDVGTRSTKLSDLFPQFIWVMRDMALRLETPDGRPLTASEYLEQSLHDSSGGSDKASVRGCILDFFPSRIAYAFARPANDDSQMQNMEHNSSCLNAKFRSQLEALRTHVYQKTPPMTLRELSMTPRMYAALCKKIAESMNNDTGVIPVMRDSWSMLTEIKSRDAKDEAVALFDKLVAELEERPGLETEPPSSKFVSPSALRESVGRIKVRVLETFDTAVLAPAPDIRSSILEHMERCEASLVERNLHRVTAHIEECLRGMDEEVRKRQTSLEDIVRAHSSAFFRACDDDPQILMRWFSASFEKLLSEWIPNVYSDLMAERDRYAEEYQQAVSRSSRLETDLQLLRETHESEREAERERASIDRKREVEHLQQSISELEREKSVQLSRISEFEARIIELTVKMNAADATSKKDDENDHAKGSVSSDVVEALRVELEDKDREIQGRGETEQRLRSEVDGLKETLAEEQALRVAAEKQVSECKESFERIQTRLEEHLVHMRSLQEEQKRMCEKEKKDEVDKMQRSVDAKTDEIRRLNERVETHNQESRQETERYRHEITTKDSEISKLRDKMETSVHRVEELEGRIQQMIDKNLQTTREREQALLQADEKRMQERIAAGSKEAECIKQISSLETETRYLRKRVGEFESCEREAKQMRQKTQNLEIEVTRLTAERDFHIARKDELVQERESLKSSNQILHTELGSLRRERELFYRKPASS